MSTILRAVALAILILLLDWYFFQAVKHSIRHTSSHVRTLIVWLYWGCTACTVALIALPFAYPYQYWSQIVRVYGVSIIFILTLSKITGSCVLLLEDVSRLLRWTWQKLVQSFRPHPKALLSGTPIPRKQFVAHLALITAAAPLSSLLYGMARGAFHYTVHRATIVLPHLPQSFNGLRIVQISDLH
ncbi:MAG: hypothetical protein RML40_10655, partial [Bacteroidota bacterium]|nr:hypothetical protein [Candidatus Kapabacteria bacterium]MDW8220973.1 hypothetical protein [Bacteroidota bacterium]